MQSYDERWAGLLPRTEGEPTLARRLKDAHERALGTLRSIEIEIERVERVTAFNKRLHEEIGVDWSAFYDAMPHDGRGIECAYQGMRFTILPCKGEVWGERNGERITP